MTQKFKVGDWVVFDLKVGQIKDIKDGMVTFTDGNFQSGGRSVGEDCRPLTLNNKVISEDFYYYYKQLNKIDGENGFNYPRISDYFRQLALIAMDNKDKLEECYNKAREFINSAREYKKEIDGVRLFRKSL